MDYPDLGTAFLLAADPFIGGYTAMSPQLSLTNGHGLDCH